MSSPMLATQHPYILLHLLFLSALNVLSVSSSKTEISFPHFSVNDSTMRAFGDVQYNADNGSIIMNAESVATQRGNCAMLMYDGKTNRLHIQDSQAGKIASFSTFFTFKFTNPQEQKIWDVNSTDTTIPTSFSFVFTTSPLSMFDAIQARTYLARQPGACKSEILITLDYTQQGNTNYFGIAFNNGNSFGKGEPSNNFIRIFDGTSDQIYKDVGYIHNLCGNEITHCSYLSDGGSFTAWIDLTPERSLQVRLINGSYPQAQKPLTPLLELLNYQVPTAVGDYVSLTFLASSAENHIQAHELLSWSFYSNSEWPKKKTWVGPVYGVSGTLAALLVLGLAYFSLYRPYVASKHSFEPHSSLRPHLFSYKELCFATRDFSEEEKLGSGGFGTVYKGSFKSSGKDVVVAAVKRINYESNHAETTFLAEISTLSQIRHKNVVQLQGWCHEKDQLLLVYDYMPNRSLNEWLHDLDDSSVNRSGSYGDHRAPFSLKLRHRILEEVASAVEYLHKDCPQCILHRDIKSSNVMLDADFKAHLGDFGLARLMDHQKKEKTTMAGGTIGYMAPEMPYTGKATKESDVFSFGILVLEVICGRRPLELNSQEPEDMMLLSRVWRAHEVGAISRAADPRLLQTSEVFRPEEACEGGLTMCGMMHVQPCSPVPAHVVNVESSSRISEIENVEPVDKVHIEKKMVENLLRLGLLCCLPNPEARPTMERVVQILQEIGAIDSLDYAITNMSMPSVPTAKPLGLYYCMEFSQTADSVEHGLFFQ